MATDFPNSPLDPEAVAQGWLATHGSARKATINDIATLAGVSKKTVSRIINDSPLVKEQTRQDVKRIIELVGYVPDPQARGLAFRHAFLVGMIYDNPNPQYIVNMQQGILNGIAGSDHELVVHPCDRSSPDYVDRARAFIERQKLFGVILTPSVSEDETMARMLRETGCGYVRIASISLDDEAHMLVTHDRHGARLAAEHIATLGHTRIGHITGRKGFRSALERQAGFEEGLAAAGLTLTPNFIVEGDYTFQSGVRATETLLSKRHRPTALFAANDEMAAGALQALRVADLRAPDAISVVGFDDFQIATTVWPRLTTIHSPISDIGERAAQRLLNPDDDAEFDGSALLPTLIVRETSGPPPRS
ncbi:MAG: LacI family DNA-binding transcriptional regulator [Pseudomonadota bacterium]